MRIEGRHYRDEWLPNYYPARNVAGQRVRVSRTGRTQILPVEDDEQLQEIWIEDDVFRRLEASGHIITRHNAAMVFHELEKWHEQTYRGPHLHIVVLTKRCNLACRYCHMNPESVGAARSFDLTPELADEIVRFAFSSPSPVLKFEFQGGEPLLNFSVLKHFVHTALEANKRAGKEIDFSVVSNLMLVRDEHLAFLREYSISLSYSLNGPKEVHDSLRVTPTGGPSFDRVVDRRNYVERQYPGLLSTSPLCVIGAENAEQLEGMVDFYHSIGVRSVAIIRLKNLGHARENSMDFDAADFIRYYLRGLDHIYEKNKNAPLPYAERSVRVVLGKLLSASDIGYVDWRNPCGDVSGSLTYDYDGEILPSDDARSLRHRFGLGNVSRRTYSELVEDKKSYLTMNLSLRDRNPLCRECAYNPYCGVSPVLEFARSGTPEPRPNVSDECLFVQSLLDWTFRKLLEDPVPLFRMLPGMDAKLHDLAADIHEAAQREDPITHRVGSG